MSTVQLWTGRETRALRGALRMSVRVFAEHLGVAPRTVSKWERLGEATRPYPDTQAILDTALQRATAEAQARFQVLLADTPYASVTVKASPVGLGIRDMGGRPRAGRHRAVPAGLRHHGHAHRAMAGPVPGPDSWMPGACTSTPGP